MVEADFTVVIILDTRRLCCLEYKDLPSKAESLARTIDGGVEAVQILIQAAMPADDPRASRFLGLMVKGHRQLKYHYGGDLRSEGGLINISVQDGLLVHKMPTLNVAHIKHPGTVTMAIVGRLANAFAWSMVNDVKLNPGKHMTRKTWDQITLHLQNPWAKSTLSTCPSEPEGPSTSPTS